MLYQIATLIRSNDDYDSVETTAIFKVRAHTEITARRQVLEATWERDMLVSRFLSIQPLTKGKM